MDLTPVEDMEHFRKKLQLVGKARFQKGRQKVGKARLQRGRQEVGKGRFPMVLQATDKVHYPKQLGKKVVAAHRPIRQKLDLRVPYVLGQVLCLFAP